MREARIAEWKKAEVEDIKRLFMEYPIVGIIDMKDLPALQLQRIKKQMRGIIVLKMTKKRLIKVAMNQIKDKNIENLKERITGMPGLIFTKEDPFKLYKLLSQSKSSAPAKAGQIAPRDLVIPAGPTNFLPGPMIGELGQAGIKTSVEGGKIAVREDSIVARKGEVIKPKVADVLTKFGVEPMEIGLNIVLIYEKGEIIEKDVLSLIEEDYGMKIMQASREAFSLAVFASYINKDTAEFLIKKANMEANALAKNVNLEIEEKPKQEMAEEKVIEVKEEIKEAEKIIEVKEKVNEKDIEKAEKIVEEIKDKAIKENVEKEIDTKIEKLEKAKIEKKFHAEEDKANEILRKLQDEKIKKGKT